MLLYNVITVKNGGNKMYNVYNKIGILILENIEHWQLIQLIAEFKNEISFKKA